MRVIWYSIHSDVSRHSNLASASWAITDSPFISSLIILSEPFQSNQRNNNRFYQLFCTATCVIFKLKAICFWILLDKFQDNELSTIGARLSKVRLFSVWNSNVYKRLKKASSFDLACKPGESGTHILMYPTALTIFACCNQTTERDKRQTPLPRTQRRYDKRPVMLYALCIYTDFTERIRWVDSRIEE